MLTRLRCHRWAVHTLALILFLGSALGMFFAVGNGTLIRILLGTAVFGAILALGV